MDKTVVVISFINTRCRNFEVTVSFLPFLLTALSVFRQTHLPYCSWRSHSSQPRWGQCFRFSRTQEFLLSYGRSKPGPCCSKRALTNPGSTETLWKYLIQKKWLFSRIARSCYMQANFNKRHNNKCPLFLKKEPFNSVAQESIFVFLASSKEDCSESNPLPSSPIARNPI